MFKPNVHSVLGYFGHQAGVGPYKWKSDLALGPLLQPQLRGYQRLFVLPVTTHLITAKPWTASGSRDRKVERKMLGASGSKATPHLPWPIIQACGVKPGLMQLE